MGLLLCEGIWGSARSAEALDSQKGCQVKSETDIQCLFRDASDNWDKRRGLAYLVYPKAPRLNFEEPGHSGSFVFGLQGSFVGLYMGGGNWLVYQSQ